MESLTHENTSFAVSKTGIHIPLLSLFFVFPHIRRFGRHGFLLISITYQGSNRTLQAPHRFIIIQTIEKIPAALAGSRMLKPASA